MYKKQTKIKKNTSILIGNYYKEIINREILSGRYSSASEVIRAGLRLLEKEEFKTENLRKKKKRNTKIKTNGIEKQHAEKEKQYAKLTE